MRTKQTLNDCQKLANIIRPLSKDYTPRQIAKKLNIAYVKVLAIQVDPIYNIQNPKREGKATFAKARSYPPKGCFDYNNLNPYF